MNGEVRKSGQNAAPFTARFLFRKLLHFAWRWITQKTVVLQPKIKKE